MFRAPLATKRVQALAAASVRRTATTKAAAPATTPGFATVKFQKEDVEKVMAELPEYNFYEIREPVPNPYKDSTLDRSVLLESKTPVLKKPQVEMSQLENGLKIASIDKQGLNARLGLFVNAGSRYENASNFGVSHMVSLMGYTSTAHLSHLRTVKTLEQLGANGTTFAKAGREDIVYSVEVAREFVPLVVPLMVGNVLFPRLVPWEVKAAHKKVKAAREAMDADTIVSDLLHKAAFCNNSLGFSPYASERSMSYFTPETIRSFMLDHFAPERMTLVGVNVEHAELAKWAMRSFADYNAIPMKARSEAKAAYTGGDLRQEGNSPFAHVALAFESAAWGQKELAPLTLLQTILGNGSAVNAAPGSGVTARLATLVQQNSALESCAAFNTAYSDTGLFGVYGVCQPEKAGDMCTGIAKVISGCAAVSKDELDKAKAMLKGNLFRQVDDDAGLMQDLGSQIMLSGKYGSAADFAKVIDGVTEADVAGAVKKLLAGKPTIAAYGDTHTVPHYAAVEATLKA